jgi:hypothetical protein
MTKTTILSVLFCLSAASAFAHPEHKAPAMPKDFDTLKGLVGTWEGKAKMHGEKEENVTTTYELTSGGTAIIEKFMTGTPMEMVTVYHKEGKSLGLTHYCAEGNQPHMVLKKAAAGSLAFEMKNTQGVTSMKESHMHALTLNITDKDSLTEEWTHMEGGKGEVMAINFKRKK